MVHATKPNKNKFILTDEEFLFQADKFAVATVLRSSPTHWIDLNKALQQHCRLVNMRMWAIQPGTSTKNPPGPRWEMTLETTE